MSFATNPETVTLLYMEMCGVFSFSFSFLFKSLILVSSQMFEFYERVSGARMHAAYVRPGGVHQVGEEFITFL